MRRVAALFMLAMAGPAVAAAPYALPPLDFPQVVGFLDAIDIDGAIAAQVDAIWQPAIDAVIAANPGQRAAARTFADGYQVRERAAYRPVIAFELDRAVTRLLEPALQRRLDGQMAADFRRWQAGGGTEAQREQLAKIVVARRAAAVGPVRAKLDRATLLARSPDGVALRTLVGGNFYRCLPDFPGSGQPAADARLRAYCTLLLAAPPLVRLRATPAGSDLVLLAVAAQVTMLGTVAMAHDAGRSARQMIPADAFAAAHLAVPSVAAFPDAGPAR